MAKSVKLIIGKSGSGKTAYARETVKKAVVKGRPVVVFSEVWYEYADYLKGVENLSVNNWCSVSKGINIYQMPPVFLPDSSDDFEWLKFIVRMFNILENTPPESLVVIDPINIILEKLKEVVSAGMYDKIIDRLFSLLERNDEVIITSQTPISIEVSPGNVIKVGD